MPDVLVMTATPIPRTAAMTVYGDLDVSTLDEMPPGRRADQDDLGAGGSRGELTLGELSVWAHVREEVAAGRQAYVVCPLIEESEKLEARSAQATYDELSRRRAGRAAPRAAARPADLGGEGSDDGRCSAAGSIDVLVPTTVIEVGVDVPNATVMVILDADRFGIAQLHQLRGRVGRGAGLESWCYLVGAGATEEARAAGRRWCGRRDGFELAEVDLDIRGEGTIMGDARRAATT